MMCSTHRLSHAARWDAFIGGASGPAGAPSIRARSSRTDWRSAPSQGLVGKGPRDGKCATTVVAPGGGAAAVAAGITGRSLHPSGSLLSGTVSDESATFVCDETPAIDNVRIAATQAPRDVRRRSIPCTIPPKRALRAGSQRGVQPALDLVPDLGAVERLVVPRSRHENQALRPREGGE